MVNILVLGDSIAKGVGSSDAKTKSYAALVGEKVNGTVTNLGITGLDSSQLIEKIGTEEFQKEIREADVIFVSIGSNDLLKPFLRTVADAAGASGEGKELFYNLQKQFQRLSKESPLKAGDVLATAVKDVTKSEELKQACRKFPKNFETIIKQLRKDNPSAVIYVDNIYNPYYGVVYEYQGLTLLNIHDICESYIVQMNRVFDRDSKEYQLLDMYSIFRQEGYTHVNPGTVEDMSEMNFDPHPNDRGYQLMADYIYTQMDSIAPEVDVYLGDDMAGAVAPDVQKVIFVFSEQVRTVKGKTLKLDTKGQTYTYTFTGKEQMERKEDGTYVWVLPMKELLGEQKQLAYNQNYQLTIEEGAVKDKGNNSLDDCLLLQFETAAGQNEMQAGSVSVVNPQEEENAAGAHKIMWVSAVVLVVIAVAITITMRYNHHR